MTSDLSTLTAGQLSRLYQAAANFGDLKTLELAAQEIARRLNN